uniref:Uncharacterized protein n=1 Tax=Anguilla anguilla TaxID=7936 RepID=A0A0E9TLU4_ANGAN
MSMAVTPTSCSFRRETGCTWRKRSKMATVMYRVSCGSWNLECTWMSQSTRSARMRSLIS